MSKGTEKHFVTPKRVCFPTNFAQIIYEGPVSPGGRDKRTWYPSPLSPSEPDVIRALVPLQHIGALFVPMPVNTAVHAHVRALGEARTSRSVELANGSVHVVFSRTVVAKNYSALSDTPAKFSVGSLLHSKAIRCQDV